jgi:cysteinyl-tRNA synthetase
MLKLYNSFSSSKENFIPFKQKLARVFICGPTVYDYMHIGHARIFLTYDLLSRFLNDQGLETDILVNMTDINQNVFHKAKENSMTCKQVAEFYASEFIADLSLLGIKSVNRLAYVSDYVSFIESEIKSLEKRQIAYTAHGNVYLDVSKAKNYGKMSQQTRDQLSMHRLDIGPGKKNQEDIMLWNCSEDFDFTWKSDFGYGVPWWHMQDTAVAIANFGRNYDIHGGARELLYPHHEAHLAQYQLITENETPVKLWMHVGLVLSDGEKMSKSIGNVVWIKDIVKKYGSELLRLYLFSKHYRDDLDFSEKDLIDKRPLLDLIHLTRLHVSDKTDENLLSHVQGFIDSLRDDLDTPAALAHLEKICLGVKDGYHVGRDDFSQMCSILGVKV